ncbi:protein CHUP1, chloroplastic [Diospyros lotus]|uniref:protein CHUP1, chloroplastic n=1 Tax=Diospyros lotus TaxID=55363 RepID=UPI00225ABE18|nr:protein CHUP1, chloroplastic [Diospyros lotus]
MEGARAKAEVIKPVLLKAGIPLAISVAGFIIARLSARRNPVSNQHEEGSREDESFHGLDSKSLASMGDDEQDVLTGTRYGSDEEEEIFRLRYRIRELQEKEGQLEARFLLYCNAKEEESILMELQSNLLLEIACVEFLGREASSMEAENRRLEELGVEYLKILEQLGAARLEKRLLHRKVKKLLRKTRGMSCVIRQKNMQIEAGEAELLRNQKEGERKDNVIRAMEDQIPELRSLIDQLQKEKNELQNQLQLAENSASSQIEAKGEEDYNELVKELERVKKDQSVEAEELVFLRWCNACLRHQLMKKNQEEEEEEETEERNPKPQFDLGAHHEHEHEHDHDHDHSKRPKLIQKLKRWVEGSEKMKQKVDGNQKHGGKCCRGSSVSDGTENHHLLPPGNSCSSP